MALDPAMEEALKEAVKEAGQPEAVGKRLVAWLTHLSEGQVSREGSAKFYEELMDVVVGECLNEN